MARDRPEIVSIAAAERSFIARHSVTAARWVTLLRMKMRKLGVAIAVGGLLVGGAAFARRGGDDPERRARHAEKIAQYDTNKDGRLDDAERAAMRDSIAEGLFKKFDTDGNGSLSLEEFKAGHRMQVHERRGAHHGPEHD